MTWELTLVVVVAMVLAAGLAAWVLWLVHDSAPIEVKREEDD